MVFIKELLPNPAGKDTEGEYLTLLNNGTESVNLRGWWVTDASGKKFTFGNETILPNQEIKLPYVQTRINLNNDGDTITLYDVQGRKMDELGYGQAGEEEIVASSKIVPPAKSEEIVQNSPLAAQAFTGGTLSPETISPLLIAFGLALAFGIGSALLVKKLISLG